MFQQGGARNKVSLLYYIYNLDLNYQFVYEKIKNYIKEL